MITPQLHIVGFTPGFNFNPCPELKLQRPQFPNHPLPASPLPNQHSSIISSLSLRKETEQKREGLSYRKANVYVILF